MTSTIPRWAAILILLATAAGCGDDDTSPADDGGRDDAEVGEAGGEDGGDDADAVEDTPTDEGGATGSLTVLVRLSEYGAAASTGPAVGATVALDAPGGERREAITGADGRATFDGIDWSLGTASVTSHVEEEGRPLFSRTGITEADGEVTLQAPMLDEPDDYVHLTGTAANVPAASTYLLAGTNLPGTGYWALPPDWDVTVPPSGGFTLVANARHCTTGSSAREAVCPIDAWQAMTHGGVTADTTLDLDFGTPIAPTTVHGSFPLPAAADSRLRTSGVGWINVVAHLGSAVVGQATHTIPSADGNSIDFDLEYIEPEGVDSVYSDFLLLVGNNAASMVISEGRPTDGPQDVAFLELPELVDPPSMTTRHALHDPIVIEPPEPEGLVALWIIRDDQLLWWVQAPPGSAELTVPAAPSTVDEVELLGTGLVEGQLEIAEPSETSDLYLQRVSYIGPLLLEP